MCGRFSLAPDKQTFEKVMQTDFDLEVDYDDYALPRYNIAPSQAILALIHDGEKYRLGTLKWGFTPQKSKHSNFTVINARSETAIKKPLFKSSLETRRCLILADGFYEWRQTKGSKTPMRFVHRQMPIITMAGIYTKSKDSDGTPYYSVAILTQEANADMQEIHGRMPVLLSESDRLAWVHPANNKKHTTLERLLDKKPANLLKHFPVSSVVNNPGNDLQECTTPKTEVR